MSVTPVCAGHVSIESEHLTVFTTARTQLEEHERERCCLVTDLLPGTYQVYAYVVEQQVFSLYIIHHESLDPFLESLASPERFELTRLGDLEVTGPLLVADPAVVYDNYPIVPQFPRYVMNLWGRDQNMAREWLLAHEIPHDEFEDCVRIYGINQSALERRVTTIRHDLHGEVKGQLALIQWCKDTGMLWEYLCLSTKPRVVSYQRDKTIYQGVICRAGFGGEEIYNVEKLVCKGETVGLMIRFEDESDP